VTFEVRLVESDADHEVALELNNTIRPEHAVTIENVRSYIAAVPQEHWLAWAGDRAVGTASAAEQRGRGVPLTRNIVRPEIRRQGVGSALYREISGWSRERGAGQVEAWIDDEETDGLDFARARGFVEVSRELKVALELEGHEPLPVDPPPGIEIVTWTERPDAVRGMYEVYCEAEPDIPGYEGDEVSSFEAWLANDMSGSGDRPEWTFVALAGDEVVGYAKFSLTEARPHTAFHDLTGVRRAWRGRGIAGALKRRQIAWAKENGYRRVVTNNEERNEPIRRLNERLGYKPALGRRLMRGPLADV
jgi:GNAT superfamily N-acetyltransferase